MRVRREIFQNLKGISELERATVHFALFADLTVDASVGHELSALPEVTVIRTADRLSFSKALADGLRILRGTLREEDVIVTLTKEYFQESKLIAQMVNAVFAEYYNPKRVILGPMQETKPSLTLASSRLQNGEAALDIDIAEDAAQKEEYSEPLAQPQIAAFYGWLVQFQLKNEEFDNNFAAALKKLKVPFTHLNDLQSEQAPKKARAFSNIFPSAWRESAIATAQKFSLVPEKTADENKWAERLQRLPLLFQRVMISTLLVVGMITALVVFVSPKVNASFSQFFKAGKTDTSQSRSQFP